jgi:peptide/nickel transport system substrate-binding protein/oligopeptide transport system substrate-binding protein
LNDLHASACFACGKPLTETVDEYDTVATPFLPIGTLLNNRYKLLNRVGEGGFATVYRAEDTQNQKIVAIKAIGLAALNAQQMIDATDTYNRELLFGRALRHPHLPAFYESFTDQHHWYLVVQYIDGPTLETYVQQKSSKRLPLWEVLDIGIQICDVLTYLHTRRPPVIFRDMKPDNIMCAADGMVYLVDFGIARHFQPGQRRDTQLLGSPGYAAPEQYGSSQTDERSDIYSLGATLNTLLTGGDPLDETIDQALPVVTSLSPAMAKLLERMQAQMPEDRPASAQEVRAALEDVARQQRIGLLVPSMQQAERGAERQPAGMTPLFSGTQYSQMAPPPLPYTPPPRKRSFTPLWITLGLLGTALLCVFGTMILPGSHSDPLRPVSNGPHIASPNQQMLSIGVNDGTTPPVLDPALAGSAQDQQIMTMLYAGLTTVDRASQIEPGLAQSWSSQTGSENGGLDWTFRLRPNLKFSDGHPLTSSDVAFSIDRAFKSPTSEYAYLAQYFKDGNARLKGNPKTLVGDSLLTPDPSTLIIRTTTSGVFLPTMMSTYCFLVVNKSLVDKYGNDFTKHLDEGGSSGLFKQVGGAQSNGIELDLNSSYYGNQPQLRKVFVRYYKDEKSERADYTAGRLSMMEAPDYDSLTKEEQSNRIVTSVAGINYLGMNYLVKPFDNIKIRQAFALALDKFAIMDGAFKAGSLATNHIIPEGQPGYSPSLSGPAGVSTAHGDPTLAKRLLDQGMQEEGIPSIEKFPTVTFTYNSWNIVSLQDEMKLIQKQWTSVLGITVKMEDAQSKPISDRINGSVNNPHGLQLWYSGWTVDYPDPQNWTTLQFTKGSPWNASNYGQNQSANASAQQQVQTYLLKADALQDPQQRLDAYRSAEQQLVNDVAWLPISQNNRAELVKPNVQGYQINESSYATPDVVQQMHITA